MTSPIATMPSSRRRKRSVPGFAIVFVILICIYGGRWLWSERFETGAAEDPAPRPPPTSPVELFQYLHPTVVRINSFDADGKPLGHGSGFLVSADGRILTNHHVIRRAASVSVLGDHGREYQVEGLLGTDPDRDLAILKVQGENLPFLSLEAARPPVGSDVFALGNPKGLNFTFSDGMVSGYRQVRRMHAIQTTTPVSPGSSGGPLVNEKGQVVGVVVAGRTDGQNLNFAVVASAAQELLQGSTSLSPFADPAAGRELARAFTSVLQQMVKEDPERARTMLLQLEPRLSSAPQYWLMRARTEIGASRVEDARASLQKVIELAPDGQEGTAARLLLVFLSRATDQQ